MGWSANLLYDNRGPSGYGLGLKEINNGQFEGNRIVSNRVGVYTDMSPVNPNARVEFNRNLLAYNDAAIVMLPGTKNNVYHENIFLDNNEQIMVAGEGNLLRNTWAVDGRGNYWSDYAGFDADQDGVGDLAYEQRSLYENLMDKHPGLRLFQLSPATNALDLAAKAFPIFQPQPKMADPNPLVAPPLLPSVRGVPQAPTLENALVALGMVAMACALLFAGTRTTFVKRRRTPAAPVTIGSGRHS
ncbi:MAG: hypothetical protein IPK16_18855 [Anaerolineales bacterium]|nr:hypothetical protein [Anaerolineales bacterium]